MQETSQQDWLDHLEKTNQYVSDLTNFSGNPGNFPYSAGGSTNPTRPLPNKPPIFTGWDQE